MLARHTICNTFILDIILTHPDNSLFPYTTLFRAVVSVNADLSNINLSEKLVDQKMVYIPEKGEDLNTQNDKKTSHNVNYATHLVEASKNSNDAAININTATESQLISIPGIGQTKAKSI